MTLPPGILADTDPNGRFIIALAFGAIWVISAIVKSLGNKTGRQRLQESLQRVRQASEVTKPQPNPRQLAPEMRRRLPPMVPARAPKSRRATNKPVPAIPIQSTRPLQDSKPPPITDAFAQRLDAAPPTDPRSPTAEKSYVSANANALTAWLRPDMLRRQFILTEIFQPPLALRESNPHA